MMKVRNPIKRLNLTCTGYNQHYTRLGTAIIYVQVSDKEQVVLFQVWNKEHEKELLQLLKDAKVKHSHITNNDLHKIIHVPLKYFEIYKNHQTPT